MLNKCYVYVKIKPENSMIKAEDVPLEFAYFFFRKHFFHPSLSCFMDLLRFSKRIVHNMAVFQAYKASYLTIYDCFL